MDTSTAPRMRVLALLSLIALASIGCRAQTPASAPVPSREADTVGQSLAPAPRDATQGMGFSSRGMAPQATVVYEEGPASADGTGRYFMGREIARVMSHRGAAWLERADREREE